MTQLENAKSTAAFMNEHPQGSLEDWNATAEVHGMVRFDYSDDTWYRNEEYVVCRKNDKYDVESIDRYEVERKTVWRVLVDGDPVSDWMDGLGSALECAASHVHTLEGKGVAEPAVSFEKKHVII